MNVNEQMNVNEKCKWACIILTVITIGKWDWNEIFGKRFRPEGIQPLLDFLAQQGYLTRDDRAKTGYSMAKNPSEVYFKDLFDSLNGTSITFSGKTTFFPAIDEGLWMQAYGGDSEYYASMTLQNALENMANLSNLI